jgi:8-oxo-dGTP pyrophosphatase MutT (NUDIX family)
MERYPLDFSSRPDLPVSCGTMVISAWGDILLCHVTGHDLWDLPKGMQEPGEPALVSARRELFEETGLAFDEEMFIEVGCFDFRPEKRLHLFRVQAPETLQDLGHLICASHFLHRETGLHTPEMDGFCWASREDVTRLCGPNMQRVLLGIDW